MEILPTKILSGRVSDLILIQAASALINRNKNCLPYRMKLLLYNALVVSNLNYCSEVWGGSESQLGKLEKAQKRCIRIVTNSRYNAHSQPLFHKTNTLALKDIIELNYLKLGNRVLLNLEPKVISDIFPKKLKSNTRSDNKTLLEVPKVNCGLEKRSPQYKVPIAWNRATHYGFKLLTSTKSLTKNFKIRMNMIYSYFNCELSKCYPCGKH